MAETFEELRECKFKHSVGYLAHLCWQSRTRVRLKVVRRNLHGAGMSGRCPAIAAVEKGS
jgi:hypothetical protein